MVSSKNKLTPSPPVGAVSNPGHDLSDRTDLECLISSRFTINEVEQICIKITQVARFCRRNEIGFARPIAPEERYMCKHLMRNT